MNKAIKSFALKMLILIFIFSNVSSVSAASLNDYKDIQNSWAKEYIEDLISLQKIDGYNNSIILPDNLITRAEFSKILVEVMDINKDIVDNTVYFSDVKPTDWYYKPITVIKELGIIKGYDDGTFKPLKNISRAEMLAMIVRISKNNLRVIDSQKIFKDVMYNYWGYKEITTASKSRLIAKDDYYLKPDEFVTRAEVFYSIDKMLWNQKYQNINSGELFEYIKQYNNLLDLKYNNVDSDFKDLNLMSFGQQIKDLQELSTKNKLYNKLGVKVSRSNEISNPKMESVSKDFVKISFEYNLSEKIILKTGTKENNEKGTVYYYLKNIDNKWYIYRIKAIKEDQIKNNKLNLVWDCLGYPVSSFGGGIIDGLGIISPTWFTLADSSGEIKSLVNKEYIDSAHKNGYKVWALVTNDFDKDKTSLLLNNPVNRKNMITKLVQSLVQYNIDGLNVDFENMKTEDKDLFTQFIKELSIQLKAKGIILSVDVTVITPGSNWSSCYDRKALAQYADYIAVMAYDQHWSTSPISGSVAQISWVEVELCEILEQVPNTKLLLGMPFYTRVWKEVDGIVTSKAISMTEAQRLVKENSATKTWDAKSGQYYCEYKTDNAVYKIWLEDAKSIDLKSKLVKKYDLAGVASWRYGFETHDIWNVIKNNLQ